MGPRFTKLRAALQAAPGVAAAWVFGSVARGEARADSDLDVAVLLRDREATPLTHRRELSELAALLEDAAARRIDLVVLSPHDPIIFHRVLSEGVLVVDAEPARRIEATTAALARYFDWAPRYEAASAASLRTNLAWAREEHP
jgi:uncharacterized protein